jgi:NTP pyrophosphatase (non-canonical NTP hydrolase)
MIINNNGVIRQVIDQNGHKMQSVIAIEEMSELTKELTKMIRSKGDHDHLVEELADVMICLLQVREMYNVKDEELQNMINNKLERLKERLKHE